MEEFEISGEDTMGYAISAIVSTGAKTAVERKHSHHPTTIEHVVVIVDVSLIMVYR